MHTTRILLLGVSVVLVLLPWLLWRLRLVRAIAPLAVVQILVGIALGPSLLGRIAPEFHHAVFTGPLFGALNGISTLGVLLYVFVAGMHLDATALRDRAHALAAPALGSFLVPLALGVGLGAWIAVSVDGALGPRGGVLGFAAAFGACIACTALPVLAAILREAKWTETKLGQTALALAALNDAALWIYLAVILALAAGSGQGAVMALALSIAWGAAMIWGVRPLLEWVARLDERAGGGRMMVATVTVAFASAAVAEAIDLGFIVGGFAAGVAVPQRCRAALLDRLEPVAATVLLPFFFMSTGLRAMIEPDSAAFLFILFSATAATMLGKVAGVTLPARRAGEPWSHALALGALMQSKGLMEVVVLAVLLDAGLIGQTVYSAMVAMAVVCTVAAAPLARIALRGRGAGVPGAAPGERAASG